MKRLLEACDRYIRDFGAKGIELDKPNSHRLLELCVHSITTYGHAQVLSELVLERTHRMFKGWLEKNSNPDSHLTAIDNALARDWMGRLISLFSI